MNEESIASLIKDKFSNIEVQIPAQPRRVHIKADKADIDKIAVLGIRSAEKEELKEAKKLGLFFMDAFTIQKQGILNGVNEVKEYLKNNKVYLTLDIDVIDPAYAPGTSTPEPFGLKPLDILECIKSFSSNLVGFDLVEVCPPYDNGETSLLAAKLIRLLMGIVGTGTTNKA